MSAAAYGIALGVAIICGAIAVFLQRRLPRRAFGTALVAIAWGALLVVAFRLVTGQPAPYFWSDAAASAEPWERLAFPLAIVAVLWPALRAIARQLTELELWLALLAASLPLWASLPAGESYLDVLPGNALWSMFALLAVGANWLAGEKLVTSGGERWSLWVFVAQLLTVAGLLMTCYATLAEWSLLCGLTLAALATCRLFVSTGQWTGALTLPATVLSCSLLTHVRIYSGGLVPLWLVAVPMLLPVLVCGVDRLASRRCHPRYRVAIAAASAALISVVAIGLAVAPGDADW